jgi:hypothetical protein
VDEKETPRDDGRLNLHDESGMTRRDLMRRGAIVGGTLLWVAPAIQSIGSKAYAQVGPSPSVCAACYCFTVGGRGNLRADECSEDGLENQRASSTACETFCRNAGFADFQYCMGTTQCNCQQGVAGTPFVSPPLGVTCA